MRVPRGQGRKQGAEQVDRESAIADYRRIVAIPGFNWSISGFGDIQVRISPFWNPHADDDVDPIELFVQTLKDRIGMNLAMAVTVALTCMRANRRGRMRGTVRRALRLLTLDP